MVSSIAVLCRTGCGVVLLLLFLSLSLFLPSTCNAAPAEELLTKFDVVLLQPDTVYQHRVPDIDGFAAYIRSVQAVITQTLVTAERQPANGGFLVIALRPGHRSNVWLDFDTPLPASLASELSARIRTIFPATVKDGPIAFSIKLGLWGGKGTTRIAPNPAEWKAAQNRSLDLLSTDELIEKCWID